MMNLHAPCGPHPTVTTPDGPAANNATFSRSVSVLTETAWHQVHDDTHGDSDFARVSVLGEAEKPINDRAKRSGQGCRKLPTVSLTGICLAASLALAACGDLPRPYQPDSKLADNPLVQSPESSSVIVLPVDGLASLVQGDRFATAMARALRRLDVPATVRGGSESSLYLSGRAKLENDPGSSPDSPRRVAIDWSLIDPDGKPVGNHSQRLRVAPRQWQEGDHALLTSLAANAAGAIAAMLGDPAEAAAVAAGQPAEPESDYAFEVGLLPVVGAPGSGNEDLAKAMSAALMRRRIAVADSTGDASLLIACEVTASEPVHGNQQIEIVWVVRRPDGDTVGRISQANSVPAGSLDGSWGSVAPVVADGAASGLIDLIRKASGS